MAQHLRNISGNNISFTLYISLKGHEKHDKYNLIVFVSYSSKINFIHIGIIIWSMQCK